MHSYNRDPMAIIFKHLRVIICMAISSVILNLQIISGQNFSDGVARQGFEKLDSDRLFKLTLNSSPVRSDREDYSTVEGDPYLYRDFAVGEVIMKTGEKIPLLLRFNAYTRVVQFRNGDEIYALLNQGNVYSVLIDTLRFVYTSYLKSTDDDNSKANTWFILKKDGNLKLLVMKNLRIQPGDASRAYQPPTSPKFISVADSHYLEAEGKSAIRIEDPKDLLPVTGDKSPAVMKFMKTNKLGVKKTKHLIKIIEYYNTLQ